MNRTKDEFTRWAAAALEQYPVRAVDICFLGHSDNLTFRVDDALNAQYLLRLHYPVAAFYSGVRQLPEAVASELAWLEALGRQGGFTVQQPVYTDRGDLVASAALDAQQAPGGESSPGGEQVPCTLLTWLPGAHFSPADASAPEQITRLGRLVAQMHAFAEGWTPPPGFFRPSYDVDHFRRIFARLLRGVDLGVYSEETYWTLRATGRAILSELERLPTGPEDWGMVHADLHVGNFLVYQDAVIPIDFSFCGWGHYLFDVSICLAGGIKSALRPSFLAGYRSVRALPESDMRAVEAYALAGRISYYAYQIDNPTERSWLQRRIPELVGRECKHFLEGASILMDL